MPPPSIPIAIPTAKATVAVMPRIVGSSVMMRLMPNPRISMPITPRVSAIAAAFRVTLIVSLAMFLTVFIAKSIGCTLPLLAKKLRLDPALMASPIITTLVDACSLTILFGIAAIVL